MMPHMNTILPESEQCTKALSTLTERLTICYQVFQELPSLRGGSTSDCGVKIPGCVPSIPCEIHPMARKINRCNVLLVLQNSPNMAISYHRSPTYHTPKFRSVEEKTAWKKFFQAHQSWQKGVWGGGSNWNTGTSVLNELVTYIPCWKPHSPMLPALRILPVLAMRVKGKGRGVL